MSSDPSVTVVQVWADNVEEEFSLIGGLVDNYSSVTMYIESSGIDVENLISGDHYELLKRNVNMGKIVQMGLVLSDGNGNLPNIRGSYIIWQFNFNGFNRSVDIHTYKAIVEMNQSGIDFQMNLDHGIESAKFAELLMSSGLVCNEEVSWVSFHSAFDCGYLVKMLSGRDLTNDATQFMRLLKTYFGLDVYDVKHLMKQCEEGLCGGLDQVAKTLKVDLNVINFHQAGAKSLKTLKVFEKIKDLLCNGNVDKYAGVIYGLEHL